jgi:hypothetical protein
MTAEELDAITFQLRRAAKAMQACVELAASNNQQLRAAVVELEAMFSPPDRPILTVVKRENLHPRV